MSTHSLKDVCNIVSCSNFGIKYCWYPYTPSLRSPPMGVVPVLHCSLCLLAQTVFPLPCEHEYEHAILETTPAVFWDRTWWHTGNSRICVYIDIPWKYVLWLTDRQECFGIEDPKLISEVLHVVSVWI